MVLSQRLEVPDLVTAIVHGVVTPNDHADVIGGIRAAIASAGSVRVLIVLDSFGGWVPDPSIYNEKSWLGENEKVSRIAVVGRPEWRRSVLTLIAQPIRRLPIRYFETETAARQWLGVAPCVDVPAIPS
jgi:hypothetical protein